MSKKLFIEKELKVLSNNPYVKSVSSNGITYTDDFKRLFISEYEKGNLPRQIFEENGFDIEIVGIHRVNSFSKRWRAAYRQNGVHGLHDGRRNPRKTRKKELSFEEKYARLEAQNNLLKAENELLKKMKLLERGLKINK